MAVINPNLLTPYADPQKAVVYATIRALNPLMATYTDELGNAVQSVIRDTSVKELVGYPALYIWVDGGEIPEWNGDNIVTESADGMTTYGEVTYWGAQVHVAIEARLALERERLMGFLIGGSHSFSVLDQSPIVQSRVPEAVQRSLAANGVWLRTTKDISRPAPDANAPRVADTIYKGGFTWECDVSLQWQNTGISFSALTVTATVTAKSQSVTTVIAVS